MVPEQRLAELVGPVQGDLLRAALVLARGSPAPGPTTGARLHDDAVIGWVDGAPVPASALAPYMARLAARPAGARLGVTDEPGALSRAGPLPRPTACGPGAPRRSWWRPC